MTEAERDKLLMQIALDQSYVRTELEHMGAHVDALRGKVAEMHDEHVIAKSKREDHTAKIERLEKEAESFKMWRAGLTGQGQGATAAGKVSWVVLVALVTVALAVIGLVLRK